MESVAAQVAEESGGRAAHPPMQAGAAEGLGELAHEAKNMVTALGIYCDLLEEPGVLAGPFAHYGSELRLVTATSRRLVERLESLGAGAGRSAATRQSAPWTAPRTVDSTRPAAYLIEEILMNYNLLAALAGPAIAVTVEADGGMQPVRFTGEDLIHVLVNLVKNATEAMPGGGRIRILVTDRAGGLGTPAKVVVAVEDDGPGIPEQALEAVFQRGYTTRAASGGAASARGLGLAISRSIVEAVGGRLVAVRHAPGARFEMVLPVEGTPARPGWNRTPGFQDRFVIS